MAAASAPRHVLHATLIKGRGLAKADDNSNFCEVSLYNAETKKQIADEGVQKSPVAKGVDCDWHHKIVFGENSTISRDLNLVVVVEIFEKQTFSSHTPLGMVQVPLSEIPEGDEPFEKNYKVEKKKLKKKGNLSDIMDSKKGDGGLMLRFQWHDFEAIVGSANFHPFTTLDEAKGRGARATIAPGASPVNDDSEDDAEDEEGNAEADKMNPNCLLVRIVSASGLRPMDTGLMDSGKSDPMVRIEVGGNSFKTKVIKKTLEPVWNEEFMIPCYMTAEFTCPELDLIVEDEDFGGAKTDFMGKVGPINLEEYVDREFNLVRDVELKNKHGKLEDKSRGSISFCLQWVYLKKFDKGETKKRNKITQFFFGINEDDVDDDSDEEEQEQAAAKKEKELSPEEKKALEEAEEQKKAEAERRSKIKIDSGDYMVQVHIIEVRDLAAKDLSGTSDPVVFIEMFGQKQQTGVKDQCLSCVFDELFIFNEKDVDKDALEDMQVRICVMDADSLSRNDLIGSYVADLSSVYFRDHHELYRNWVGLVNDEEPEKFTGVQGYCKLSIQVIGPKDKLHTHDEKAEKKKEKEMEAANAGGLSGPVIMPASLRPEWMWLVTTVWRSEYMPSVDATGGIDACFKVQFEPHKKGAQTKTVSKPGFARDKLNADFCFQLWLPVATPTTTKVVKLILGDYDGGVLFNPVATSYFEWSELMSTHNQDKLERMEQRALEEAKEEEAKETAKRAAKKRSSMGGKSGEEEMKGTEPEALPDPDSVAVAVENDPTKMRRHENEAYWCPMYGAKTVSAGMFTAGAVAQFANSVAAIGGTDWSKEYNTRPDLASTYRGRVLISQRLHSHQDALGMKMNSILKKKVERKDPFRRKYSARRLEKPREEEFVLSAVVVSGIMLAAEYQAEIEITCGKYTVGTGSKPVDKKAADFCSLITTEREGMKQPFDHRQIPDVIVYLKQKGAPIAFHRVPARDLLEKGFTMKPIPEWQQLKNDRSMNIITDKTFPGTVLLALGMGTLDQWNAVKANWESAPKGDEKLDCELRVHLYQCRGLPDADMGGGIDPFMKVRFGGEEAKTHTVYENNDPMYYQTFRIGVATKKKPSTIKAPKQNDLLHMVNLQVFDEDMGGMVASDYIGMLFHKFQDNEIQDARMNNGRLEIVNSDNSVVTDQISLPVPARPVWEPLFFEEKNEDGTTDCEGEVLASFQLIRIADECRGMELPPPPSIQPAFLKRAVEVICIGIRDMAPYNFLPMQQPHMKFKLDGVFQKKDKKNPGNPELTKLLPQVFERETESSKKPIPKDANFLTREILECELPEDPIFCPPLKISVFDTRLGGFLVPEVGKCVLPLSKLCPWNKEYVPRDMSMLNTDANAAEKEANDAIAAAAGLAVGGEGGEELTEEEKAERVKKIREQQIANNVAGIEEEREQQQLQLEKEKAELKRLEEEEAARPKTVEEENVLLWQEQEQQYDEGLGVFSAMKHVDDEDNELVKNKKLLEALEKRKKERREKIAKAKKMREEQEEAERGDDFETDETPVYMRSAKGDDFIYREELKTELELEMLGTPFDRHELSLGSKIAGEFFDADYRIVGFFKGMVRVLWSPEDEPLFDLKDVLFPAPVTVRAYVLGAHGLAAKDVNMDGSPGKSDPYLVVKLGKETINQVDQHFDDCIECDFHQQFEFKTEIPGMSMLTVEVFDYDTFGSDDLIGRTRIDLEDRWFDKRWVDLGREHRNDEPPSVSNNNPISWDKKPLETRRIFEPTCKKEQGYLEFWVDILRPEEAAKFEAFKVALPPNMQAEVRLIIWKAREVPAMDSLEQMNDMYTQCWCEGTDKQVTDTHWRAKKGKASWNYRMKFNVELGHSTMIMKFPYLRIQTWDADLLKWNDIISEYTVDMELWLKKCYKKQEIVCCYKDPPTKKERKEAEALLQAIEDDQLPEDEEEEDEDEEEGGGGREEETNPLIEFPKKGASDSPKGVAEESKAVSESELDEVSIEHAREEKLKTEAAARAAAATEGNEIISVVNDLNSIAQDTNTVSDEMLKVVEELHEHDPDAAQEAKKQAAATLKLMHDNGMNNEDIKKAAELSIKELDRRDALDAASEAAKSGATASADSGAGTAVGALEMERKPEESKEEEPPKKKSFLPFLNREKKPKYDGPYGPNHPDWDPAFPEGIPPETWCHCIFKWLCLPFILCGLEGCWAGCPCADAGCCPCCICCWPVPKGKVVEAREEPEYDEDTQALIDQFRDLMGWGESKPKDSEWLAMDKLEEIAVRNKKGKKTGEKVLQRVPMGKLCVSLEILPGNLTETVPAGFGRTAPNTNPSLPPPSGRLKFSLNPFTMGADLCGPALCAQLTCCLVVLAVVLLCIFCAPVGNIVSLLIVKIITPSSDDDDDDAADD